eukprot:310706-Pyramimonas_sp.AAC.1
MSPARYGFVPDGVGIEVLSRLLGHPGSLGVHLYPLRLAAVGHPALLVGQLEVSPHRIPAPALANHVAQQLANAHPACGCSHSNWSAWMCPHFGGMTSKLTGGCAGLNLFASSHASQWKSWAT